MVMDDESPQKPWICAHTCDDAFCSSNRYLLDYLFPVILFFYVAAVLLVVGMQIGSIFFLLLCCCGALVGGFGRNGGPAKDLGWCDVFSAGGVLPPSRVCYFGKLEPPMPKMDGPSNRTKIRPAMH
jgi:hypothetical protein